MCLLNFVEQERPPAFACFETLGDASWFALARSEQQRQALDGLVLGHIEPHHPSGADERLRKTKGELRLADTRRPEEEETSARSSTRRKSQLTVQESC